MQSTEHDNGSESHEEFIANVVLPSCAQFFPTLSTSDLLDSNADAKRVDGALDQDTLVLVAADDDWLQKDLLAPAIVGRVRE